MLFHLRNQPIQFGQLLFHPRLHQRRDGAGEKVDDGLLAAAEAGAVAADHGAVVALVEQQGFQRTDLFVQIVDAAELLAGGR